MVQALLIFNLRNDLDFLSILTQDFSDVLDVISAAYERRKDHINLVLHTEPEVVFVLFGQCREIDVGAWKVDTFLGCDLAVVECSNANSLVVDNLENLERLDAIINIDELTRLEDLCNIFVVDIAGFWSERVFLLYHCRPTDSCHR